MGRTKVYDYVKEDGSNAIEEWLSSLAVKARAKVKAKIKHLSQYGANLPPDLLSDTNDSRLKKLRIRGRINPRLYLCKGPVDMDGEYTLLHGVLEKDNQVPEGTERRALDARQRVISNPTSARTPHDFEAKKTE